MSAHRDVVVLGSTGSIGRQAIEVATAAPERFRIVGIAGGGGNVDLLARQALELGVDVVAVARATAAQDLQLAFYAAARSHGYAQGQFAVPKILAGPDAVAELAAWPCDVVLNGITGSIGLAPTLAALDAGRTVALANKESLIAGGPLVLDRARPGQLVPVDSEHSALAQCLRAGRSEEVRRLILTASGGPFRGWTRAEMDSATVAQAMAHPTWDMGPVITINSATLVNKGLELIEAHLLFGVAYDAIDVVVHPQSIVHSMVEFADGSTIAQASPPDMKLPIAVALGWPERVPGAARPVDWSTPGQWTFEQLDSTSFPAVALARAVGAAGGCLPAVFNAANEEAVGAFVAGRLAFTGILDVVRTVVDAAVDVGEHGAPQTVDDVLAAENWARGRAVD
ncbi:MAG: 1-deoxy-D-xylulose-5-phosphate reductoisomerase, partial [Geodermatophilaceae bacterium]|nr:1-deoxy-D-xylulose-5-phosphate reductoisomerase [Geodermatophilaceae bacterium]